MRRASVLTGRRLSRRAFLRAAAASGIVAAGAAGVASAAFRPGGPGRTTPSDQLLEGPIADVAAALAYDVDSIFRFVADEIAYQPYTGSLRGPLGTLAARAGNSVDQSVLLAALLDASLIPYRFAVGKLDAATAADVIAAASLDAATSRTATLAGLTGSTPGGAAPQTVAPDAETQAIVERARAAGDDVVAWARDQVAGTVADIAGTIGESGFELPDVFTTLPLREVDRHMWVQQRSGVDWLDLDPTLPARPIGQAIAELTETLEALPDDLYHRVRIAVIGERTDGVRITTETLLDVVERADLLAGIPITFLNARPEGISRLAESMTLVGGVTTYVPSLILGEEAFAGAAIRFGRPADPAEDFLGSGELFGGGRVGDETTAEWLELTVSSPDAEPVAVRRTIFDRFGAEARASGSLDPAVLEPATMIVPEEGTTEEVLAALASTWLTVGVGGPSAQAAVLSLPVDHVGRPAVFAYAQQLFRELADVSVALPLGSRSFADAPNVTAYSIDARRSADGEQWVDLAMDIWHRSRGSLPVVGVAPAAPPAPVAGILDHVVERLLMGHAPGTSDDPGDGSLRSLASVGSVFDAARAEGIGLRLARSHGDVDALGLPAAVAAHLKADLDAGWLAVVPGSAPNVGDEPRTGWWLLDPATGRVSDRLDDGGGAAQGIEYQATLTPGQLARETAEKKLARQCLVGATLTAAAVVAAIAGGIALADDNAALALAAGAGNAGAGAGAVRPLARCIGAATA
jgi:Transglutaminase-like superfamily